MFQQEERICSNEECSKIFIAKVYNAIYCSIECRKFITNKKILEKYHQDKENKKTKRNCKNKNCKTVLSKYNKENICEQCKVERYIKRLVSWGWDEKKLRNEL